MKKLVCLLTAIIIANLYSRSEDSRIVWVFSDGITVELLEYISAQPEDNVRTCIIGFEKKGSDRNLLYLYFSGDVSENIPKTNRYIRLVDRYIPVYFDIDFWLYESEEDRERNKTAMYRTKRRTVFNYEGLYFYIDPIKGTIFKESPLIQAE